MKGEGEGERAHIASGLFVLKGWMDILILSPKLAFSLALQRVHNRRRTSMTPPIPLDLVIIAMS